MKIIITYLNDITNITATDYENLWDAKADYWLHNWGKQEPPTQIQTPLYKHNINPNQNTKLDITQTQHHINNPITSFKQELSEQVHEFRTSMNSKYSD